MDDGPLFTSADVSWHVLQDAVFLVGGLRALILQLANPGVAQGVADHSDFVADPFTRARRTLELMQTVGLGSAEQARRAVEHMHRTHGSVRGADARGRTYDARDEDLRIWVLATLIDTVLVVEQQYLGRFDDGTRRRYYSESLQVAAVFGIESMPPDLDAFRDYMDRRISQLEVTDTARRMARHVLWPKMRYLPAIAAAPLRVTAIDLLPEPIRAAFGLGISERQSRWVARSQALSRATLPRLPARLRRYTIWHTALDRRTKDS